jgi:Phage portal protein
MAVKDIFTWRPRRLGRPTKEPTRESVAFPNLVMIGQNSYIQSNRVAYKPTPRNLRYFSNTPIARRAINTIKNPLSQLEWEIAPNKGVGLNSELRKQIEIATLCFSLPNDDDSFNTLLSQVINDVCLGAGVIEIGKSEYPDRPVYLWPVDGLSINIYPGWKGGRTEPRYLQTLGYGGNFTQGQQPGVKLRDDEVVYIRPNPSTHSPFGYGPLEVAFQSISNQLATASFAAKLAGNALPPFAIDLGEVSTRMVETWRTYWTNEIEGQGKIPIIGTELVDGQAGAGRTRGLAVQKLYPEGDKALYLQYQEFIRTEVAAAFDISNMSLNLERDVNRSTAEVGEDREWIHAIKPMAMVLANALTRKVVWGAMGYSQLRFVWRGVEREDLEKTSTILTRYYGANVFTPNEIRRKLGEPPAENAWGDMTKSDADIAIQAAKGTGVIDDPDLASNKTRPQQPPTVGPAKPAPGAKPKQAPPRLAASFEPEEEP